MVAGNTRRHKQKAECNKAEINASIISINNYFTNTQLHTAGQEGKHNKGPNSLIINNLGHWTSGRCAGDAGGDERLFRFSHSWQPDCVCVSQNKQMEMGRKNRGKIY